MPVCKSPRYTVKVFDRDTGNFVTHHICYLRDVPHVHPLLKDLTKGIIDHIVHRPHWNDKTKQMEWRCKCQPRSLAKYPYVHIALKRPPKPLRVRPATQAPAQAPAPPAPANA